MDSIGPDYAFLLNEACEAHDAYMRSDYSGRGMYGRTCLAIVCDSVADLFRIILAADEAAEGDGLSESLTRHVEYGGEIREDSMGRSTVWYFPQVTCEDEWETAEEAS